MSKAETAIPRVKLEVNVDERQMRAQLAGEAKEVLGYGGKVENTSYKLAEALQSIETTILHKPSVQKYMASKERKLIKPSTWGRAITWIVFPSIGAFCINTMENFANAPGSAATVYFILGLVGILISAFVLMVSCSEDCTSPDQKYTWHSTSIEKFDGYVPTFALSRAIEIKKIFPQAKFRVDFLTLETEEREIRRSEDPFLSVSYGEETYYIDVWDEEEFEKKV